MFHKSRHEFLQTLTKHHRLAPEEMPPEVKAMETLSAAGALKVTEPEKEPKVWCPSDLQVASALQVSKK